MPETRILLLDDHSLFRESLSRLLEAEPGIRIVGSCASTAEALDVIEKEAVDVVLLDYDLGDEEGIAFQEQANFAGFRGRILLVTAGMNDATTLRVLENGAVGVFLKHNPPGQLVEAIAKVAAGDFWLDSTTVKSLIAGANSRTEANRDTQPLTNRERSVLKGVFEGLTNKEIAANLSVSESSVKASLQQLFAKTGVRTRSQLVRIALEKYTPEWLASGSLT